MATLAQLKLLAAARGIHVPSKATKAQIVKALVPTFDRGARDILRRQPVLLYDPANTVTAAQARTRMRENRFHRRHNVIMTRSLTGVIHTHTTNLPKGRRLPGAMTPATHLEIVKARAAL